MGNSSIDSRPATPGWSVGVDTGGTFTDVVLVAPDGQTWSAKVPSTPADPAEAVLAGIAKVLEQTLAEPKPEVRDLGVVHGSTVATNALLERRGARTALVTTQGLEDLLTIGRQARPDLYDLEPCRPPSLISVSVGIRERVGPDGSVLQSLEDEQVQGVVDQLETQNLESVAICLLHSYACNRHERALAKMLSSRGFEVSVSSILVGEFREVERAWTTVANAYVAPIMRRYLRRLTRSLPQLRVMLSSGGAAAAQFAIREPIRTLLSGPAGGVIGARHAAADAPAFISFDMGGTSTDVALCDQAGLTTSELHFAGLMLRTPALDLHTVGAGGGSIASVDAGGGLRVGPRSAGARPGPACYGLGGEEATVTDANLVLGRLCPEHFLGGEMALDAERAQAVCRRLGEQLGGLSAVEAAHGVVRVACAIMARAVREITVARGLDPRQHELVAFGGAGPMHGAHLAAELGIARVRVPVDPGTLSARGMLAARLSRTRSRTLLAKATSRGVRKALGLSFNLSQQIEDELRHEGAEQIELKTIMAMRYVGQSHELAVPYRAEEDPCAAFRRLYAQRYGGVAEDRAIEIVTVQVRGDAEPFCELRAPLAGIRASHPSPVGLTRYQGVAEPAPVFARADLGTALELEGPCLVVELSATTVVPPGWNLRLQADQGLLLSRKPEASA